MSFSLSSADAVFVEMKSVKSHELPSSLSTEVTLLLGVCLFGKFACGFMIFPLLYNPDFLRYVTDICF